MNTFFTDRDLGHQFPAFLSKSGISVELHDDHFGPTTSDETWLAEVGRRGWFVLTRDTRIRYRPNERNAVMTSGVGMFLLVGTATHDALARNFVATLRAVNRFIDRTPRPFIAKIKRPTPGSRRPAGAVELWLSHGDWKKHR